jgi:hypothetical protein
MEISKNHTSFLLSIKKIFNSWILNKNEKYVIMGMKLFRASTLTMKAIIKGSQYEKM